MCGGVGATASELVSYHGLSTGAPLHHFALGEHQHKAESFWTSLEGRVSLPVGVTYMAAYSSLPQKSFRVLAKLVYDKACLLFLVSSTHGEGICHSLEQGVFPQMSL